MKTFLSLLLFLILCSCEKAFDLPDELIHTFELSASNTTNSYQIYVVLPAAYDENRLETYPVVYLLDGDWDYERVALEADNYLQKGEAASIIVGIGYIADNERNRDYTPTEGRLKSSGKADDFLDFIQQDLIPTIETTYHVETTSEQRLIMGHSLGGLLAAYCFITRNDLFDHYSILSPSLWWDEQIFFKMEKEHRAAIQEQEKTIYLGIGEMEPYGMNPTLELFYDRLVAHYPEIKLKKHRVEGKGHNDSKPENIQNGLQFFLQNL